MSVLKPSARLLLGDCRAILKGLEPDSVDAIVTDPPYGLSEEPDIVEVLSHWLAGDVYEHSSAGFMGKDWDSFVPGPGYWKECFRVLKPGGHLVAFSSNRTEDLLGIAIRLAGFKRRDLIAWLYYNGFPKNLDISKEFDRMRDDREELLQLTAAIAEARDAAGLTNRQIDEAFGFSGMAGHWTTQGSQPAAPTLEQWAELVEVLGWTPSAEVVGLVEYLNGRKGEPGEAWHEREVIGRGESGIGTALIEEGVPGESQTFDITAPHSDEARDWAGWGTHLKPALEPALLFQKPISESSIARNVRRWGTGAINIDGCRIPYDSEAWPGPGDEVGVKRKHASKVGQSAGLTGDTYKPWAADGVDARGRYPANVYHCKKPSTEEREAGCDHLPKKGSAELVDRVEGSAGTKSPRAGAGRESSGRSNFHPTLKPLGLMRWLVRLLTPPGGTVLDPFMGSGTTGVAAMAERVNFIGCELSEEYLPIAVARVDYVAAGADVEAPDGARVERIQRLLFGGPR